MQLHGVDLDLSDYGEAVPTLTAIALFADSPTRLRGIAHLRGQETDRLAALAEEFGRLGAPSPSRRTGCSITPTSLAAAGGVVLDPRADHRLAMAYAVAGLRVAGVLVSDIATTGKTVPDFPQRWARCSLRATAVEPGRCPHAALARRGRRSDPPGRRQPAAQPASARVRRRPRRADHDRRPWTVHLPAARLRHVGPGGAGG